MLLSKNIECEKNVFNLHNNLQMKKNLFLAVMLLCASLVSCSKDEDENGETNGNKPENQEVTKTLPKNHAYVDFNLPSGTLWAKTNVGANKPQDFGYYFAWGETTPYGQNAKGYSSSWKGETSDGYLKSKPKKKFDWSTYMWANNKEELLLKYNNNTKFSTPKCKADKILSLSNEDDAANVLWKEGWQTPTLSQVKELLDKSICVWTSNYCKTGVSGILILKKNKENEVYETSPNSFKGKEDHLFFPAAGDLDYEEVSNPKKCGFYWIKELDAKEPRKAYTLDFNDSEKITTNTRARCFGRSIRPVFKK